MFEPAYTITNKLLENIKSITSLVHDLNRKRFPNPVLAEFIKNAESLSVHASTSIEGNPLPLTDVKRILKHKPENIRDSEQEVLNYNEILKEINKKLEKESIYLTLDLILYIQKKITHKLIPSYQSGRLRVEPVFVNDPKAGITVYWPPDHKSVPYLMEELIDFVDKNKKRLDPLIIAGLFHKQMVIIHPFMDGNGRTTRIATKILMAGMELNIFNLFSFENYYNQNVAMYFEMVGVKGNYYEVYKTIDFTSWLEYFTHGIIDELTRVGTKLPQIAVSPQTELKPYHKKILDFIDKKGFITDHDYCKLTSRAKATRRLDFNKLIKLGLIIRSGKGKNTHYVLKEK
ncbi:Fic family protein [Candidatus Gottesmanbacteria bacterium]|nr:Fic family protein [Candidatus Gottesmanbacteria bacterium]